MKRQLSIALISLSIFSLVIGGAAAQEEDKPGDSLRILAVSPDLPLERGVEVELTIDVEATLDSTDEGIAMIGFNSESPARFRMEDSHKLASGAQVITFVVRVVPTDWGDRADFSVLVNMGAPTDGGTWMPTAGDRRAIELTP